MNEMIKVFDEQDFDLSNLKSIEQLVLDLCDDKIQPSEINVSEMELSNLSVPEYKDFIVHKFRTLASHK